MHSAALGVRSTPPVVLWIRLNMLQSGHASGSLEPVGAQKPESTGVQLRSLVRPVILEKVPASGPNTKG